MKSENRRDKFRELTHLREELEVVNDRLRAARFVFNFAVEDDLVFSSIYEINMLNSRYSYLLRRIKLLDAEAHAS